VGAQGSSGGQWEEMLVTERDEIMTSEDTEQSNVLDGLDSLEVLEASDLDEGVAFHAFRFKV